MQSPSFFKRPSVKFYCFFFKTAFPKLHQIELWSFIVLTIIGIYCHFSQNGENLINPLIWQVPLWVTASITVIRLILAPHLIWKEQQEIIIQKELELVQKKNEIEELKRSFYKLKNPLADRIPLMDIKKNVVEKGWKTVGNSNISQADNYAYDFVNKMVQGIKDDELRIWGNKHGKPLDNTLDEISKDHFTEQGFTLDYGWLRDDVANTKTQTKKISFKVGGVSKGEIGYQNLHVSKTDVENLLDRWIPSEGI